MRNFMYVGFMACIGFLLGSLFLSSPRPDQVHSLDNMTLRPKPQTLEALVADSDLIVIGTVGDLVKEGSFLGYNAQGGLIAAEDLGAPKEAELPFFDYEIKVEEVIKADSSAQSDNLVIMRALNQASRKMAAGSPTLLEFPAARTGERYLFLFKKNKDNATYGLKYGPASRLILDKQYVTLSDGAQTILDYNGKMTPKDFKATVKKHVEKQR